MAITSSIIVMDHAQPDGRRWVTEQHTYGTGEVQFVRYLAGAADDVSAAMAARVASLEAARADREALETVG